MLLYSCLVSTVALAQEGPAPPPSPQPVVPPGGTNITGEGCAAFASMRPSVLCALI